MLFYGALKPFIDLSAFEIFASHLQQVRVGFAISALKKIAQMNNLNVYDEKPGFQFALLNLNLFTFPIMLIQSSELLSNYTF